MKQIPGSDTDPASPAFPSVKQPATATPPWHWVLCPASPATANHCSPTAHHHCSPTLALGAVSSVPSSSRLSRLYTNARRSSTATSLRGCRERRTETACG